ncbi:adenylate/guanylate cyclase domain-containing protein [Marinilabiliaceae bacterium ANBcel2]|nr:adenylate/guanylate cyclase domain-containing protein [Marinilabiliaceae bacterium ANBcel2]
MRETENFLDRVKRLAGRNKALQGQLEQLVSRIVEVENQSRQYQDVLLKYSTDKAETIHDRRKLTRRLRMVSVLYISVQGFEKLYRLDNPNVKVDLLDEIYLSFEDIAFRNNIVKLNSLGDMMLYGAGLQGENRTNPIDTIRVALEMLETAQKLDDNSNGGFWEIKFGIHTGPVLAIPNDNRSSDFNFSGDSINTACRIGESAQPGTISVSVMTYELIKEFFDTELTGYMPVKYKGNIETYSIKGYHPEFISADSISKPNGHFHTRYMLLKFMDLQEEMLDYLEVNLPDNLYYHNVKHTIDVVTEVELIGWAEGINEEEILLLKFAALFHDAGHTISYKDHEYHGTVMAREKLNSYDYSQEQIDIVCRLIMATKMPPRPKGILEKIICDADLDYLGRRDFIPVSNALYREFKERDMVPSLEEWNKMQLNFIRQHQYFTETAQQLREVNKNSQISRLEKLIQESVESNSL